MIEYRFEEHFRDSYVEGQATPRACSTSTSCTGRSIRIGLIVTSIEAEALVLPWQECPRALASAQRIVGWPVVELRAAVREELVGTSTCTHLNDTLRVLADLSALAPVLRAVDREERLGVPYGTGHHGPGKTARSASSTAASPNDVGGRVSGSRRPYTSRIKASAGIVTVG